MKIRLALAFAVVVSLAGLPAFAGTAASTPAAGNLPFCLADASPAPALPVFHPSATPRSLGSPCGVCSQSVCLHAVIGSICGGGGTVVLRCGDFGTCTQDGKIFCACARDSV